MSSSLLRRIRIVFSTLIFIFFVLVFVDFKSIIPASYIGFDLFTVYPFHIKVLRSENFSCRWFSDHSSVDSGYRANLLLISMSPWDRTGPQQPDWRKNQKEVQEIWV